MAGRRAAAVLRAGRAAGCDAGRRLRALGRSAVALPWRWNLTYARCAASRSHAARDLEEGTMLMVQVDGTNILLVNQDGLYALQGTCSHEYFELDKGFLGRRFGDLCAALLALRPERW